MPTYSSQQPELPPCASDLLCGKPESLDIRFDHGLGDCVHFAAIASEFQEQYGTKIRIECENNKRAVFECLGFSAPPSPEKTVYHRFDYKPDFNNPQPGILGSGSKLYASIKLPSEDERQAFWKQLCSSNFDGVLYSAITAETQAKIDAVLRGLPEPIVLLHSNGTNWAGSKNIPHDGTEKLYSLILDNLPGTLILLDWDNRVPQINHCRVRHLKRHFGHLEINELAALYVRASLLIGIDSGPFHLSHFTDVPALGVFHHHYPACVTLPRAKNVVMTRSAPTYRACNLHFRKQWNLVEYAGDMPTAEEIYRNAERLLIYGNGARVAFDQWAIDWQNAQSSISSKADRCNTWPKVFEYLDNFSNPTILETGCIRSQDDFSAGYSTYLFAAYLDGRKSGKLTSVDISEQSIALASELVKGWEFSADFVIGDSIKVLASKIGQQRYSLIYLDSLDTNVQGYAEHALEEAKLAAQLTDCILIDDTTYADNWLGKGEQAVPWLVSQGWEIDAMGYQVLLRKAA